MFKKIAFSLVLITATLQINAQFFRGFGFFVGGTTSSHRYKNSLAVDSVFYSHTLPAPSHRSAEYISYSGGIFLEFLSFNHLRWQTEFEYCKKGAKERPLVEPWPIVRGDATNNTYTNIEWNNYLKYFVNDGYFGTPYFMLGARLDYNLSRSITAYNSVANSVPKIKVSPDVGVGFEFAAPRNWHLFTEVHYNPDVIKKHIDNVTFYGRMYELRVGLIYRPKRKALDDCNAPRYYGSDY
jgi:hypothetical protein